MTNIENDSVETLPTSTEVNSNRDLTSNNVNQTLVAEGSCSPTSCSASGISPDKLRAILSEPPIRHSVNSTHGRYTGWLLGGGEDFVIIEDDESENVGIKIDWSNLKDFYQVLEDLITNDFGNKV